MRSPQKEPVWKQLDEANDLIAGYCRDTPNMRYVDVNSVLFDAATGQPRYDMYRSDCLHYQPHAYDEFLTVLRDPL